MALTRSIACRDGLANTQGFKEMFDGGSLKIFSGDSPGVEYGAIGTELLSIAISSFTSAGTGNAYMEETGVILSTGIAGYFRLSSPDDDPYSNANGTCMRADGVCGVTELSCDLLLTSLDMTAGVPLTVLGNFNIPT